ncbi:MAG: hypothetical protein LBV34_13585 [Nocardiopsaceae bacterium]|jgi:hypothetical protein|nr:hypothetical protein [Nocardiopsaceae bacterium]
MSPKNRGEAIKDGARQAAAQLKPAAERARPLARNAGDAAKRGIERTRAWAAPRVERSGKVLQEKVAPKVSAMLSSAAKRIDPAQRRSKRWQKPVGVATVTAAGGAIAAFFRVRKQSDQTTRTAEQVKASPNGQPATGMVTDTDAGSEAKT